MMDTGEIVREYKYAKQPDEQITILAELNAEDWTDEAVADMECKIVLILREHGVLKDTAKARKILFRASKEERRKTFLMFSNFVADCLSEAELNPNEQADYEAEIKGVQEFLHEKK